MRFSSLLIVGALLLAGCGKGEPTSANSVPKSTANASTPEPGKTMPDPEAIALVETEAVIGGLRSSREAFMKRYNAADAAGKVAMRAEYPNGEDAVKRMTVIASQFPSSEAAAKALAFLATSSRDNAAFIDTLFEHHVDNEAMFDVVPVLANSPYEGSEERLRLLIDSPHDKVKGMATFGLGMALQRAEADEEEVAKLFRSVVDNEVFASIEVRAGTTIGDMAKSSLFEIENLGIGQLAPDIVAEDLDGVEFKLSDYRGKVVFLDFWGNW